MTLPALWFHSTVTRSMGSHQSVRSEPAGRAASLTAAILLAWPFLAPALRAEDSPLASFNKEIQPVLDQYCYDCHGDGEKKGGINLDAFKTDSDVRNHTLWWRVMKNVRSGVMPPATEPRVPPA